MTVDEFVIKVSNWQQYIQSDFNKDILLKGCIDLSAKIASRVQEKEVLGSGKSYNYSTKPALVGAKSFVNKGAFDKVLAQAKSKKNTETHWVTINKNGRTFRLIVLPGGYAEIRRLENHLNKKKNYSRTKEMWQWFGIKSTDEKKVIIGGKSEASQNKINWNSGRDKDNIIAPNEKEITELKDFLETSVKKYINASLGN